ncbi:MAG: sugar ABC transporter ATP-binding protein [Spirochaetales bacterium]|nr:sugar ABC transporter ATP-binding protein [Spirochaetales bacterium]
MNNDAIIEVKGIQKQFPGVKALKDVSFDIKRNTVHCVIGENGAGKSTFIKILTGALQRTAGQILFNGEIFEPKTIRDAMDKGISVLYQELNVVDDLTVEENLTLGKERTKFGFVKKSENLDKVKAILAGLDPSIRLNMPVCDLSVAQKQVIEIAKAISTDCQILVMDEPTAALSEEEVRRLFLVVKKLKEEGLTIIFISHKLTEIFEIGDNITVFRDGEMIETKPVEDVMSSCGESVNDSCVELVRMMLGKVVVEEYIPSKTDKSINLLEVRKLNNAKLKNVDFNLFKGEILGFYGLMGAGKTEVARALYGIDEYEGEIFIHGKKADYNKVGGAIDAGLAMVPEERRVDGIFGLLPIRANIPMMRIKSVLTRGIIDRHKENKLADNYIGKMSLASRDREQKVAFLSGGNQQKVVISKCLNRESDIILMDEPTRGVDVGAKKEIHDIIRDLANQGKGIVVFSSELPEIIQLCDRIVLMHDGEAREIIVNSSELDSDYIMKVVAGGEV